MFVVGRLSPQQQQEPDSHGQRPTTPGGSNSGSFSRLPVGQALPPGPGGERPRGTTTDPEE